MAKASIANDHRPADAKQRNMQMQLGNISMELTAQDAKGLMADSYSLRAQVRGLLSLAQSMAEQSLHPSPSVVEAMAGTLGAALTLSELAEAALERACQILAVDYDGTALVGNA